MFFRIPAVWISAFCSGMVHVQGGINVNQMPCIDGIEGT